MKKEIDIKLKTTSDPSGIVKTTAHLKGLGEVAGKVSKAFDGRIKAVGEYLAAIEKCHAAAGGAACHPLHDTRQTRSPG